MFKKYWNKFLAFFQKKEEPKQIEQPKKRRINHSKPLIDFNDPKYNYKDNVNDFYKIDGSKVIASMVIDSDQSLSFSEDLGTFENNNFKPIEVVFDSIGTPGLPWQQGILKIETNFELQNLKGRGRNGTPGLFWDLSLMAPVQDRLNKIIPPIASAPWRLQRADKPLDENEIIKWEEQSKYQEDVWNQWKELGKFYDLSSWFSDILKYSLITGFYLGECFIDSKGNPAIPSLRSSWTIEEWLFSGERPKGAIQTTRLYDSHGQQPQYRILIPIDKCVHIANNQSGATDLEGLSIIRPAYQPLMILKDLYQLQALSASLNATGTFIAEVPQEGNISAPELEELEDFFGNYEAANPPFVITPPGLKIIHLSPDSAVVDLTAQIEIFKQAAHLAMGGESTLIGQNGHGSFALKKESEATQREGLDIHALKVSKAIERAMRIYLEWRFPDEDKLYICSATWGQVEQRDNSEYLDTLSKYIGIRSSLWAEAQSMLDEMLDLPRPAQTAKPQEAPQDSPAKAPESDSEPSV